MSVSIIELTGNETDAECKEIAWEMFCTAHPHEAHAHDAEGFWRFFHAKYPDISREQMVASLVATEAGE